ncbi:MAG: cyclodeaminase/cyclohydrolase family protein [Elusimicrobiota bacterium]|nr:cyclodeaminase/cyclohydrolase family protein [Elusimicrobiota bacterium]
MESMSNYINQPIQKYLDDLSAKLPAPGGGSAAALVGATGIACLLMVVNFTVGKKGYESYHLELKSIVDKLQEMQKRIITLIDKDVEAYTAVSEAFKNKSSAGETEKLQTVLLNAMSVPEEIIEISISAIPVARRLLEIGNKNLITDVACGVSFLHSAIESAKVNVYINLKHISREDFVKQKKSNLEQKIEIAISDIKEILTEIGELL